MSIRNRLAALNPSNRATGQQGPRPGQATRRVRRATAVAASAAAAAIAGIAGQTGVPQVDCEKGKPAAALPKKVTLENDGWETGPAFKIFASLDGGRRHAVGTTGATGAIYRENADEPYTTSVARNPCGALYGSGQWVPDQDASRDRAEFDSWEEYTSFTGPGGTYTLQLDSLQKVFDGKSGDRYVLKGPDRDPLAIASKEYRSNGEATIRLQDPSSGETLGLLTEHLKEVPPGAEWFSGANWVVESMSEKAPSWLLTQLAALFHADHEGRGAVPLGKAIPAPGA